MKQFFRFFTLLAVAVVTSVQAWAIDVPLPKAQPVTVGTECYIMNVGTKLFLGKGEAWGTQAVANKTGLKYIIKNQRDDGGVISYIGDGTETQLPEGQYWLYSPEISGAAGHCTDRWQDGTCGTEYRCSFTDQTDWDSRGVWQFAFVGNNIFTMQVPQDLPDYTDFQNLYVEGEYAGIDPERKSNAADPTYGLYSDVVYADFPEKCQFFCVTIEDHDVYLAKLTLAEYIDDAVELDIDVATYTAIINNENATLDEVNAANDELLKKLEDADSWNHPKDITDQYIITPQPKSGASAGWTILDAQGKEANIGTCSDNIGEFWNNAGYSIHYTMKDLPVGVYTLRMEGWTRTGMVAVLKVGDNQVNLATVGSGTVNTRSAGRSWISQGNGNGINEISWVQQEAGDVEISLTADSNTADYWMCWGFFWLLDRGYNMRSFQEAAKELASNWQEEFVDEEGEPRNPFTQSYFDAIGAAVEKIPTSTDTESALAIYKEVQQSLNDLRENIELYRWFYLQTTNPATKEDPYSDDWLGGVGPFPEVWEEAEAIIFDADYTKSNEYLRDLKERYLKARQETIEEIIKNTKEGGSVNVLITNRKFKNEDGTESSFQGWTVNSSSSFQNNAGSASVVEQWNGSANTGTIDVSQKIAIPTIGAYRLKTKGWYRSSTHQDVHDTQEGYTTVNTYLFGASSEYTFHDIYDHPYTPAEKQQYFPKGNCYDPVSGDGYSVGSEETDDEFIARLAEAGVETVMPNNVTGADELFNNPDVDWYDMTCDFLGLGADTPVEIGVRGRNVPGWAWLIWDDFEMIYLGSDLAVMQPIAQKAADDAKGEFPDFKEIEASKKAWDALQACIDGIENATSVEALVEAYKNIDGARVNLRSSMDTYKKLRAANDELNDEIMKFYDTATEAALSKAEDTYNKMDQALAYGTIDDEDVDAAIEEIQAVMDALHMPKDIKDGSDDNPVDCTALIKNPTYFKGTAATMEGWTYEGINNVETENGEIGFAEGWGSTAEAATFDIHQTLTGLPAGTYMVKVSGLFRQGGVDAEVKMTQYEYAEKLGRLDVLSDADKKDVQEYNGAGQFYGNGVYQPLHRWNYMVTDEWNVDTEAFFNETTGGYTEGAWITYEDKVSDGTSADMPNYYYLPDNRLALYLCVQSGYYENTLYCNVGEDQKLTIGAQNQNATSYDWTPFSNWRLYYLGTDSKHAAEGIEAVEEMGNAAVEGIYTIDGRRVSGLQKGLNIVVRNGKAQKILVK